ncbi:MAG: hypothetical protein CM1200mP2_18630 [Planctomycetaceae bacterium]|nr:MAG: hypothetical protein CM1200mP2_18630 [Planctomycetaceae bacterium]
MPGGAVGLDRQKTDRSPLVFLDHLRFAQFLHRCGERKGVFPRRQWLFSHGIEYRVLLGQSRVVVVVDRNDQVQDRTCHPDRRSRYQDRNPQFTEEFHVCLSRSFEQCQRYHQAE